MNKAATFFYMPDPEDTANKWLSIANGNWHIARRYMLRTIDRHRGAYWIRRHYCAAYIWLLLNEPTPRLIGPAPSVTSLHFSPSKLPS
jgi:hypothetical protein